MRRLVRLAVLAMVVKVAKKRLPLAASAYKRAVSSGARPIEAVGTAVAAFVGLAPGGPEHAVNLGPRGSSSVCAHPSE